jgi:uncharacterized protein YecE (DUF72 family)
MSPADYLTYYTTKFNTVEIDSTFYWTPSEKVIQGWADMTPKGFLITARVPQSITHHQCLLAYANEFGEFIGQDNRCSVTNEGHLSDNPRQLNGSMQLDGVAVTC